MTLYELTGQFLELQDILAEETDPDAIAMALDTMEGLEYEMEQKADNYARIIRNLTSDIEGLKVEIERLNNRKRSLENNISYLKNRLQDSMTQVGKERFKTELFSFHIQNNPVSVVVDQTDKLPDRYLIQQEPKVDKKAIRDAIQSGEDLTGIAHLEQNRSLRIK